MSGMSGISKRGPPKSPDVPGETHRAGSVRARKLRESPPVDDIPPKRPNPLPVIILLIIIITYLPGDTAGSAGTNGGGAAGALARPTRVL